MWFDAEMRTYLCTRSLSVLRPHVLLDTACAVFSFCRYKTKSVFLKIFTFEKVDIDTSPKQILTFR